ncbi:MAG TPA: DUF2059 domain-containing protein [Candidatus Polarisedimenticolaceae bacterium]|nr:DUF2059 domain-containing protein [Candidatus Polarisedimenticolaceae bacterium]
MIRRLGIALAVAALAQGSAHAVAPIAPSHRRAAEETLRTIDVEGSMRTGVSVMVDSMVEGNAMLAPYRSVVVKWAEKFMTWETIGPKLVDLYAETFTEAELRELTAFYRTPVGRKALAAMPDLARRGAEIGTQVARDHQKELEEMVQERAKQLEAATADVP